MQHPHYLTDIVARRNSWVVNVEAWNGQEYRPCLRIACDSFDDALRKAAVYAETSRRIAERKSLFVKDLV